MKFFRRHWRKILVPVLAAAVVSAVLAVVGASKASAACAVDVDVTHTASQVLAHGTACGDRYRAVGWWGGDRDLGTYMLSSYSTACDVSPSCQGHPDGTLFSGGWQDRRTGKYHQTFTVSAGAHTTALAQRACDINKDLYFLAYIWGFKVKWVCHPASEVSDVVRSHIICEFRAGGISKTLNGGWVKQDGLYSNKACPSPGWVLHRAAWQLKEEDGTVKTVWVWPSSASHTSSVQTVMHYHGRPPVRSGYALAA